MSQPGAYISTLISVLSSHSWNRVQLRIYLIIFLWTREFLSFYYQTAPLWKAAESLQLELKSSTFTLSGIPQSFL